MDVTGHLNNLNKELQEGEQGYAILIGFPTVEA
jgi:hypothetical protein